MTQLTARFNEQLQVLINLLTEEAHARGADPAFVAGIKRRSLRQVHAPYDWAELEEFAGQLAGLAVSAGERGDGPLRDAAFMAFELLVEIKEASR